MSSAKNFTYYIAWLLIGLFFSLLFVSEHKLPAWDLTEQKLNSLTPETIALLNKINQRDPLQIEVITLNLNNHTKVQTLLNRLQKANPFLKITYRQTPLSPIEQQKLKLSTHEALVFQQHNQQRGIDISQNSAVPFSEKQVRQVISQLQQTSNHWLLFVSGHGERSLFGKTNRDFSVFASELKDKGISYSEFDLSQPIEIPSNTHLMILAGPQTDFLIKEQQRILDYVEKGGHLLWLIDPPNHIPAITTTSTSNQHPFLPSLQALAKALGLALESQYIIDPVSHNLGTPSPAITLVNHYTKGTFVESLPSLSVFPWAVPIRYPEAENMGWEVVPFLKTNSSTYLQNHPDNKGPLVLGISLERNRNVSQNATQKTQRVIVIGNGHFLSNATLHNYGNRQLIERILDWFEYGYTQAPNHAVESSSHTNASLASTHRADWHPLPFIHFMLEYFLTGLLPFILMTWGFFQSRKRQARAF